MFLLLGEAFISLLLRVRISTYMHLLSHTRNSLLPMGILSGYQFTLAWGYSFLLHCTTLSCKNSTNLIKLLLPAGAFILGPQILLQSVFTCLPASVSCSILVFNSLLGTTTVSLWCGDFYSTRGYNSITHSLFLLSHWLLLKMALLLPLLWVALIIPACKDLH